MGFAREYIISDKEVVKIANYYLSSEMSIREISMFFGYKMGSTLNALSKRLKIINPSLYRRVQRKKKKKQFKKCHKSSLLLIKS